MGLAVVSPIICHIKLPYKTLPSLFQIIDLCSQPWGIHWGWAPLLSPWLTQVSSGSTASTLLEASVQSLSHLWLFATPWTAAHKASLSTTNSQRLLKLMSITSLMPSNHLLFCHPLLLPLIFPSIKVFSNESFLHIRCPKYWSFNFSTSLSNECTGLISFRMVGSPCSPRDSQESSPTPQFKNISCSVFSFLSSSTLTFIHDYWKHHSLTRQTFFSKVMSLLFIMLSKLVIAFLPRSKRLLISWLQSSPAVILKPPKMNFFSSHCFPIYLPWSDGTRCHDLNLLNVEF